MDITTSHDTLDLVAEKIDLALRMGPLADSSMVARRIATFPNRVYASPAYLAQHGTLQHPSELSRHAALVTRIGRSGDRHVWTMSRGSEQGDFEVAPVIEADDPELLKPPLVAGAGLMMSTDMAMAKPLAQGLVQPVLEGWLGRCPDLHALFPSGNFQAPKLRAFIDFLVDRL